MAAQGKISLLDLLIFSAPKGESPFAYAANYITHILPDKPHWYYTQIIITAVLYACNSILTLASFVVVARRRKLSGESRSLWFFRTHYGHPSHVPYIMPNPLTMFLTWNILFTLLMQPYTWLNYFAWKYPSRAVTSKVYFWYGFVFIFDGAGMWMSAFGTLYATLLPRVLLGPEHKATSLLHPVFLNVLCFGLPTLLIITQLITATLSQVAWSEVVNVQFDLIENLQILSTQWLESNGTTIDQALRQRVSRDGNVLLSAVDKSQVAFVRNAWAAAAWYFLCMILFAPTAIWLLITLRRAVKNLSQRSASTRSHASPVGPNLLSQTQESVSFRSARVAPQWSPREMNRQRRQLQRAFFTATLQFITTFLCLTVAIGSFVWVSVDIHRVVTNPVAHAAAILISDWVFSVVGTLVNIFIIIRMTSKIENSDSQASLSQLSRNTHSRSLSRAHTVPENIPTIPSDHELEKAIPLHIITGRAGHLNPSESEPELGLGYKSRALSSHNHSLESLGHDRYSKP